MFGFKRQPEETPCMLQEMTDEIDALKAETKGLREERRNLKDDLRDIRGKHKIEEQQTKHLVKMREEEMALKLDQQTLALEREKNADVAKVKDEYRQKMESQLSKETDRITKMYEQILQRLPDVNLAIKQKD